MRSITNIKLVLLFKKSSLVTNYFSITTPLLCIRNQLTYWLLQVKSTAALLSTAGGSNTLNLAINTGKPGPEAEGGLAPALIELDHYLANPHPDDSL